MILEAEREELKLRVLANEDDEEVVGRAAKAERPSERPRPEIILLACLLFKVEEMRKM